MRLTGRVIPRFPAQVVGGAGIGITKANGVFTFSVDFDSVMDGSTADPEDTYVLTQQPDGTYAKVPLSDISNVAVGTSMVIATGSTAPRTLEDRFADWINVKDFGAAGDGVTDDSPAFLAAAESFPDQRGFVRIPEGSYAGLSPAAVPITKDVIWLGTNPADPSHVFDIAGVQFGAVSQRLQATRANSAFDDWATLGVFRTANHPYPGFNQLNSGLYSLISVEPGSGGSEWAVTGQMIWGGTQGEGGVGVSGVASNTADSIGALWGGHFIAKDVKIYATAPEAGIIHGIETSVSAIGLDDPIANGGLGQRSVVDVIAVTTVSTPNWDTAPGNSGYGEIGSGVMIRTQGGASGGYFRYGLVINESAGNPSKITTGAFINTSGTTGIRIVGDHSLTSIRCDGNDAVGLMLNGTYTTGNAIRIANGQGIGWEATGVIRSWYEPNVFKFGTGTTELVGLDIGSGTGSLRVLATKVVGPRATGWTAATGTATRATFATGAVTLPVLAEHVKALIDDLTTHGLIGT